VRKICKCGHGWMDHSKGKDSEEPACYRCIPCHWFKNETFIAKLDPDSGRWILEHKYLKGSKI
jgi:hypothetical protein